MEIKAEMFTTCAEREETHARVQLSLGAAANLEGLQRTIREARARMPKT